MDSRRTQLLLCVRSDEVRWNPLGGQPPSSEIWRGGSANVDGFTLLEVMIAMAIMLVAFGSILMVQSSSINTSAKAKKLNVVAMLAKSKMVETELEFQGLTFEEYKGEKSEAFKDPYQDYKWTRTIKEIKFPALNLAMGGEGEKAASMNAMLETLTKLLTKFLSKAVREVTVTITYKVGTGTQDFALTTYWVDLNHEFALSE